MATISPSERESMILERMAQVEYLARRLHRRCPQVELDDLISVGVIGLIQAVDRFDPARNLKLKTLAEHRISGALLDYLRHVDPLPRSVRRFQKQRDALLENFGDNQPTVEEIAQLLGVSSKKYAELSRMIIASESVPLARMTEYVAERPL